MLRQHALMATLVESYPGRVGHPQGHKLFRVPTSSRQRRVFIANKGASGRVICYKVT